MTKKELVSAVENLNEDRALKAVLTLDDAVIDASSQVASLINNEGPHAQIDYLMQQGFSVESIAKLVLS